MIRRRTGSRGSVIGNRAKMGRKGIGWEADDMKELESKVIQRIGERGRVREVEVSAERKRFMKFLKHFIEQEERKSN